MTNPRTLAGLSLLLLLGISVMVRQAGRLQERLLESTALDSAALLSDTLHEARTLYTQDVVGPAQAAGMKFSHLPGVEGTIPLPISFTMRLGERIGQRPPTSKLLLYSPYPFPWNKDPDRDDPFRREAWEHLSASDTPFYRFEEHPEGKLLRYATADRMRPDCVACHNSYPGTPRTDWREGDLRGVLEVRTLLSRAMVTARTEYRQTIWTFILVAVIGSTALLVVVGKLKRDAATLEERIRRRTQELESEILERRKAERLKDELISVVSHELRTPLTSIRGALGLLAGDVFGPFEPKARELLRIANQNSARLTRLIDDLLDLQKIQSGRLRLHLQDVELVPLLDRTVEDLQGYGERFKVGLRKTFDLPEGLQARIDPERISQVLGNLVSNAVKFSPEMETVEISARLLDAATVDAATVDAATVRIGVRDRGEGIPEPMREHVFQKFIQVDSSVRRRRGGTGLGLTIARSLVESHGGTIAFEEGEDGVGTFFYFDLPLDGPDCATGDADAAAASSEPVLVIEKSTEEH